MNLSIIIPTYNSLAYLKECLLSIGIQHDDVEVIIINDGSNDGTYEFLDTIRDIKNYCIINKDNEGVSRARNIGISIAKGNWILFLDCDDLFSKKWYEIVSRYFTNESNVVYFNSNFDGNLNQTESFYCCLSYIRNNFKFASPWSKMYKRKFLLENKIVFNNELINGEDLLFNLQCISLTSNLTMINSSFYRYRTNILSSTMRYNEKYLHSDEVFRSEVFSLIDKCSFIKEKKKLKVFVSQNAFANLLRRTACINNFTDFKNKISGYTFIRFKLFSKTSLKIKIILFLFSIHLYKLLYFFLNRKKRNISNDNFLFIDI